MIRYFEFTDANGRRFMCGQRLYGTSANDTVEREIATADKHLLHQVRTFKWKDVIVYPPNMPADELMKKTNAVRVVNGEEPIYDADAIRKADPKYSEKITIHRFDGNGNILPVSASILASSAEHMMVRPVNGEAIAPDDPSNPLLKHSGLPDASTPVVTDDPAATVFHAPPVATIAAKA